MAAAVLFLVSYAWPILDPGLPPGLAAACVAVGWATWALFGVDYAVRLTLAERRWRFVTRNLADLAVVALPLLRPLRLLRLLTMLRLLNRSAGSAFRGRVVVYVIGTAGLLVFVAGLMLGGIALLGTVTATLASWIVQRIAEQDAGAQAATRAQVDALVGEVRRLRAELRDPRP